MDRVTARNFLYDFCRAQWVLATETHTGVKGEIRYEGIFNAAGDPQNGEYWVRVDPQTIAEPQETLRNMVRRFKTEGLILLEIRAPLRGKDAQTKLDLIAEDLRNAFRSYQTENLEFTAARVWDSISPEANWLRVNVISNFTYRQFL